MQYLRSVWIVSLLTQKKIKLKIWFLLVVIVCTIFPQNVTAFEGLEHKVIGDVALFLALSIIENENEKLGDETPKNAMEGCKPLAGAMISPKSKNLTNEELVQKLNAAYGLLPVEFLEMLSNETQDTISSLKEQFPNAKNPTNSGLSGQYTYGDVVRAIDYLSSTDQLTTSVIDGEISDLPSSFYEMSKETLSRFDDVFSLEKASRNNSTHFQAEMINALRNKHAYAVSIAKNKINLFSALLVNAAADHFLQDYFAPGHVMTIRENLEMVALERHDWYNRLGWDYVLDGKSNELTNLECVAVFFSQKIDEIEKKISKRINISEIGARQFQEKILTAKREGTSVLKIKGDGNLLRKKCRLNCEDAELESALLIVVTTQSILDILHNFLFQSGENSLSRVKWSEAKRPSASKYCPPHAALSFGYYSRAFPKEYGRDDDSACDKGSDQSAVSDVDDRQRLAGTTRLADRMNNGIIFNYSIVRETAKIGRWANTVEYFAASPYGIPLIPLADRNPEKHSYVSMLGSGLGFSYFVQENGFRGYGFPFRYAIGLPRFPEFQVSFVWRPSRLTLGNHKENHNDRFLTAELAHGPMTFFFGLGYGYFPENKESDSTTKKTMYLAGARFTFFPRSIRLDSRVNPYSK